jgi:two-component system cell cycle response regulator
MTGNVLLIEDNPTNLELMAYLLRAYGYAIQSATNGRQGLELALQIRPDLIVCDLDMPELTGYEVARELRSQEGAGSHLPMIAVTAYAMVGDRDKVLAAGFDAYISKPIQAETFVKQVEAFLSPDKRSKGIPQSHETTVVRSSRSQTDRAVILIVDDSQINLSLIRGTLEPSGYTVIAVDSVEIAMLEIRRNSFDLILSDLHMPENSGYEFLRRVKTDPNLQCVPFVLFTASTDPANGDRERALALGAAKFLCRPIEPSRLLLEIEECLVKGRKKSARQSD